MKERLTGAVILVALIVLLVPALLTGPVRPAPGAAASAPASGEPPLRSYTIDLTDDAHARDGAAPASGPQQPRPLESGTAPVPAAADAPSPEPQRLATPPQSTPPGATPQETAPAMASPAAKTQAATPAAKPPRATPAPRPQPGAVAARAAHPAPATTGGVSTPGTWMVQLGSFANRANADRLAHQLRAQGFTVSVSQGSTGRRLYHVRAGPARDHAAALELAGQLRARGHAGAIVPR
ncbi:MAG: SPOR domain-containing protein [Gammaproteobacteria bacterium]|nr:SPOR domain-containing protein [Gammaproteobacteria bacterium]